MVNWVVAHFVDGRLLKGRVFDAGTTSPVVHLQSEDGVMHPIRKVDLKALFFVKDAVGDPTRTDAQDIAPEDPRLRGNRAVEVVFRDGERMKVLCGHYPPRTPFYFVLPADPGSNNDRILVNGAQVEHMTLLTLTA